MGDKVEQYILKEENGNVITVRDVQKILLSMLIDIDKICRKHDIPYFLTAGSCLGAVRHQGFIPWDDDLDIGMLYDDYLKFMKVLETDLPEEYVFQCFDTHKEYNVTIPSMKIRKKGTFVEERNVLLSNKCRDGNGLFIDVFVYDFVSENKVIDFCNRVPEHLLMPVICLFENLQVNPIKLKSCYVDHARHYGKKHRGSSMIGMDLTWTYRSIFKPFVYRYDTIYPVQNGNFEGHQFPIPHDPHTFLCTAIGPDYMTPPPKDKRISKHILDIALDPVTASLKEVAYLQKYHIKEKAEHLEEI